MRFLKQFLPKAGMIWPEELVLLHEERRDRKVLIAMKSMVAISTSTRQETKAAMKAVDEMLATLFTTALQPPVLQILEEQESSYEFLCVVHRSNALAAKVSEATFVLLFGVLVEARMAWMKNPRNPYDIAQHGITARTIDEFLRQAPSWTNANIGFYEAALQGGYDHDDMDVKVNKEDQEAQEAQEEDMEMDEPKEAATMQMEIDGEMEDEHEEEEDEEVNDIARGIDDMEIDG
ncbi:hypothetical protein F4821DRAFT_266121 [Hypoxylon rubiginosum]|uniref:Uncharacterized protein n=1 Tax=Hypoxylon rubiginosum TaxID=110542 RepID=A0ACC0CIH5_9PEZI|nr:hypothetical protein F4821DRAFT_266121 [Hypoxylon rubiginosum]